MNKKLLLVIFSAFLNLTACGVYSRVSMTGEADYKPANGNQGVKAYLVEDYSGDFKEIAVIEVYSSFGFHGKLYLDEAVEEAKSRAKELGANCIVLVKNFFNRGCREEPTNNFWFRAGILK